MKKEFFETDTLKALQAKEKAQWIAFGPFVFQATRALRNTGILQIAQDNLKDGITLEEIAKQAKLPHYGTRVLVEAGLGIGLLICKNDLYYATKTTYFILNDDLTKVNMDFVHDVCYKGMFYLEESIREERPAGLKELGNWPTVYEGLSQLPPDIQKSWFAFDHYYSDTAFPLVLPIIFKDKPKRLMDIGGNTGKWAMQCVAYDPDVEITITDLPGQISMAQARIEKAGLSHRIKFNGCNLLDQSAKLPPGFDAVWMSQFLDCFSEAEIVSILKRCREALAPGGSVYILETFWDNQQFEASAFSLQQTSLYFTAIANGNSQMYHSRDFIKCVTDAGFEVTERTDGIGVSHTLLKCSPK